MICSATKVEIGNGKIHGGYVMILDTEFHPRLDDGNWGSDAKTVSKPIHIGRQCFIGARAIILKGVTIGDGSVIGASSIKTLDVPAGAIVAESPAVIVKTPKN